MARVPNNLAIGAAVFGLSLAAASWSAEAAYVLQVLSGGNGYGGPFIAAPERYMPRSRGQGSRHRLVPRGHRGLRQRRRDSRSASLFLVV